MKPASEITILPACMQNKYLGTYITHFSNDLNALSIIIPIIYEEVEANIVYMTYPRSHSESQWVKWE